MSLMRWLGAIVATAVVAFVVMACAPATVRAQDAATGGMTAPKRMAADADPDWDVVTVKPSDPNEKNQTMRILGRHMLIQQQTVESMLMAGYGLQKNQLVGAPEWVKTEEFDADGLADVEGEPSVPQYQSLLRKLLEERFGLVAHKEQREMPVFALTVAKDGPKIAPAKGDRFGGGRLMVKGGEGSRTLAFKDTSMADLAVLMLQFTDRPIVDRTGLKGSYDFTLSYTYDDSRAPTDGSAPPSLFTAIQEQMGLKFEPVRAPADVVVVDKVERPGAN